MLGLFFTAIGQVLLIGILVGAGLPAIFALGVRAMAYGTGGDAEVDQQAPHPIGRILGLVCFAIVLLVILLGLAIIVSSGFGYQVSFEHIIPSFTRKH